MADKLHYHADCTECLQQAVEVLEAKLSDTEALNKEIDAAYRQLAATCKVEQKRLGEEAATLAKLVDEQNERIKGLIADEESCTKCGYSRTRHSAAGFCPSYPTDAAKFTL